MRVERTIKTRDQTSSLRGAAGGVVEVVVLENRTPGRAGDQEALAHDADELAAGHDRARTRDPQPAAGEDRARDVQPVGGEVDAVGEGEVLERRAVVLDRERRPQDGAPRRAGAERHAAAGAEAEAAA